MKKQNSKLYFALSFFIPFTTLGIIFALHGVFPFGSRQILAYDLFQQHYPFLSNFWHKIREGDVSSWSWIAGGGHDYTALIAYFMASPLNLLAMLLPYEWLRETLTFILLLKIGCAGLFTGIFLHCTNKPDQLNKRSAGFAIPVFSSLYALCAFTLGYYWSLNSFDSLMLLPLVALGIHKLFSEGKWKLYVVSLALALFANFYYSFFICIFAAIFFFSRCIIQKLPRKEFLKKLGFFAAYSVLAAGMAAVLLLPSWFALQNTSTTENVFPSPAFYTSFFDVLGNFIAFTPPTIIRGLPNLYTGMICILFTGLFFYSKKIMRREKIVFGGIFLFLLLCSNLNVLDYIIHGFHKTRDVPFRFTFLISFILVITAYRGFMTASESNHTKNSIIVLGIGPLLILLSAVFGSQEKGYIIGSAVLCFIYLILLYIYFKKTNKARHITAAVLAMLVFSELFISSYIAIGKADLSSRDSYPDNYDHQVRTLLSKRNHDNFHRTEISYLTVENASSLYNYTGLSFFSSTANYGLTGFLFGLGMVNNPAVVKFQYSSKSSPLTDAFLNMRYLISRKNMPVENSVYWETIDTEGDLLLLENKRYLPLGFMVKESLINYKKDNRNPFISQNNFFRFATGINRDLFTVTRLDLIRGQQAGQSPTYQLRTQKEGMYYRLSNYEGLVSFQGEAEGGVIIPVGYLERDKNIALPMPARADVFFGCLDSEIFERGYNQLASQPLILTKFSNTEVCGTVTALENGLLYTSIPTDGNWSVYVNGVKSEIVLIDGAMAAVRLNKGTHLIEFRYFNKSLVAGIIVSLVSLAIFVVLVLLNKKRVPRCRRTR